MASNPTVKETTVPKEKPKETVKDTAKDKDKDSNKGKLIAVIGDEVSTISRIINFEKKTDFEFLKRTLAWAFYCREWVK